MCLGMEALFLKTLVKVQLLLQWFIDCLIFIEAKLSISLPLQPSVLTCLVCLYVCVLTRHCTTNTVV